MKRVLVVFALIVSTQLNAQILKKSWMIGGTGSFSHDKRSANSNNALVQVVTPDNLSEATTISIKPTVGYFFIKNLMTGVEISYTHVGSPDNKYRANDFGAGPVIRYYFPLSKNSPTPKFAIFPEVGATFASSTMNATYLIPVGVEQVGEFKVEANGSITIYRAGAGFTWFVAPNIGLEGILGYRSTKYDREKSDNYDFSQNRIYFNVGLQVYIARKVQAN